MYDSPLYIRKIDQINEVTLDLYNNEKDRYKKYVHFLKDLQEIIYFDFGNVVFFWEKDYQYDLEFFCQIGWPKKIEELYTQKFYKEDDVFPIFGKKTPVIMKSSDMFDASRSMSQYYHDFMEIAHFDISLECNIILPEENLYGICSLFRRPDRQDFDIEETKVLEIIQPHLSNSTKILQYLNNKPSNTEFPDSYILSHNTRLNARGEISHNSKRLKELLSKYNPDIDVRKSIQNMFKSSDDFIIDNGRKIYQIPDTSVIIEFDSENLSANIDDISCRVYDVREMISNCISIAGTKYKLTDKEKQVLALLMDGHSSDEISKVLSYSVPTVKKYVSSIYRKFSINNYRQLLKKLKLL